MSDAFIVAAVRTPIGRRDGRLASCHPADLLATVLCEAVARGGVEPDAIDDVIAGCVSQTGAQSFNIARTALLSAGFPEAVPGTTVDRQCGSSQQAVHFAAQGVMAGSYDLVIAAGVEVMSLVPIFSSWQDGAAAGHGEPLAGERWRERYGDTEISQFNGAELLAERYGIDRDAMEDFAERSHSLAREATDGGRFADEIIPIGILSVDEGFRSVDRAKMRSLVPVRRHGRITPATSSQVSDGAAAVLIASSSAVSRFGLRPLARVAAMTIAGSDPVVMLDAPIPATRRALSRAGLRLGDVDLFEVNEAFASVPLAWARALEAPPERVNVNGGAIALGHPIGASGARLMTTLVHEMRRRGARYGLQTMCEAGGLANATILELHDGAAA